MPKNILQFAKNMTKYNKSCFCLFTKVKNEELCFLLLTFADLLRHFRHSHRHRPKGRCLLGRTSPSLSGFD